MIKDFFILDLSYDVVDGIPQIYIWSIDEKGERCVVIERNFRPYFYVTYNGDENKIIESIKKISKPESPITRIDIVEKKSLGNPVRALLIESLIPAYVKLYREEISKIEGVKATLESDIRYYMRYLIDKDLLPFSWFSAEVDEIEVKGLRVNKAYLLKNILNRFEDKIPNLRVLSFDVEVYNKYGSPNPRRDPIIIISLWSKEENGVQFVAEDKDDFNLLRKFIEYINKFDPDIILGYNDKFSWNYILERSKSIGIKIDVGRKIGAEISEGTYGHYSIIGRLNVDLAPLINSILRDINTKDLTEVIDYMKISSNNKITELKWYEIYKYWDDATKRTLVKQYSLEKAKSIYFLAERLLPLGIELSRIIGLPLDQLAMASAGHRLEWLLIRESRKANELIPNRTNRFENKDNMFENNEYSKKYLVGIYDDVYVIDISLIYPLLIAKYNISPDSIVHKNECEDCWSFEGINYKLKKEPKGIYKIVLEKLYNEIEDNSSVSNIRKEAINQILKYFYEYVKWENGRWFSREILEIINKLSDDIFNSIINLLEESKLLIIYADRYSILVKGPKNDIEKTLFKINQLHDLQIRIDKHYKRVLVLDNKYYGLLDNDNIEMFGFKMGKDYWCELAKDIQKQLVKKILVSGKINDAVKLAKMGILKLRRGDYNIEDLVIWKLLENDIDYYKPNLPYIIAAKKAIQAGYPITRGTKIGYVIVKGSGRFSDRAEPYFLVKEKNRIDIEYYVNSQLIPAILNILGPLGVKENTLKTLDIDMLDFKMR
ncbi:MAG: 3'-5' exonuclease [Sulfolobaceae archaeon]